MEGEILGHSDFGGGRPRPAALRLDVVPSGVWGLVAGRGGGGGGGGGVALVCVFFTAAGQRGADGAMLVRLLSLLLTGDRRGRGERWR